MFAVFPYLNSMIAMIRYVNLPAFVHTHASWVPDLPFRFSSRAELEQKATTGIKNLAEEYRWYLSCLYAAQFKNFHSYLFSLFLLSVVPEKSVQLNPVNTDTEGTMDSPY